MLPPNGDLRLDHDAENEAARAFRVSYDGTVAEWTFAVHWRAVRFDARNLTLESDTLAQRAGLAAWTEQRGAARVFDKPFRSDEILATLTRLCGLTR